MPLDIGGAECGASHIHFTLNGESRKCIGYRHFANHYVGLAIKLFSNKDHLFICRKVFARPKIIKDSLAIACLLFNDAVSCVIVIIINQTLIRHGGDLAVGAYGIVNRVSFLFIMVTMGLNQGMQPIAGYNFGARNYKRVNEVLKLTILMAIGVMTFGFLIVELFPELVASVFTKDSTLIHLAAEGLRIVFLFFPIVGFQMVVTNFFQSIGMAGRAVFLSLSRQLLFLLPFLLTLPSVYGLKGVWYSMPAADLLASLVAAYMLFVNFRKFIKRNAENTH